MTAKQAESLPGLLPHHLAKCRASGLSDATIKAAGLRSETNRETLAAMLNKRRPHKGLAPAIVFQYTDREGRNGYCRVRPDSPRKDGKGVVKYESPIGQPNQVYFPPGVAERIESETRILITEGELKSLASTQFGFPCLGLVGVYGWKSKGHEQLLPELCRLTWKNRTVFIAFDSDIERNPDVQQAERRLAKALIDRDAKVRCLRIPDGPPGADSKPTKQGLDDFLVAQGASKLNALMNAAVDPAPVEGAEGKEDASKIDPGDAARAFLKTWEFDEVTRLRYWHGCWWLWDRGAFRDRGSVEVRSSLIRHLDADYRSLGAGVINNVIDHVRAYSILPDRVAPGRWLDQPPVDWKAAEILATRRELIHLPTFVAGGDRPTIPATPKLFTTAALDFDFDPEAPPPAAWLAFLADLWPLDSDAINTLAEWMGYLLTPDTRQQKILLLVGPKRSGKGTIARVVRELVGPANVGGPTLASLATNFGLWPLLGKSAAIISDARLSGKTDSAIVIERLLSISGEDSLTVDRKNLEPLTCKLPTRLMILTNELPRLSDTSGAMASRFLVMRLQKSFYGREDHDLLDKLLPELPGILLWAIQGWHRMHARGRLLQPPSGLGMIDELEQLTSPIGSFVRECCVTQSLQDEVPRRELYASYVEWCKRQGKGHVDDEVVFGRGVRAAIPRLKDVQRRDDQGRVRCYQGVRLKTTTELWEEARELEKVQ